jgi:DNA gyrase/topoisomerase IV subunit A
LKELNGKLPYHRNVVEFIRLHCDDEIDLRRKTDEECDSILEDAGLERIDESFDYLLKLPMRTLTKENIEKHQKQLEELNARIAEIEKTATHTMWLNDLSHI